MADSKHWGDTELGKQIGEAAKDILKDAGKKGIDILTEIIKKKTDPKNKKENKK